MSDGADVLDMSVVAVLLRIKKAGFFPHLVNVYTEDSERLVNLIGTSIDEANGRGLEESSHALKSASASIGAHLVAAVAHELEKLGESGTTSGAAEIVPSLKERLGAAQDELSRLAADAAPS